MLQPSNICLESFGVWHYLHDTLPVKALLTPRISSIECVGLVWVAKESLAIQHVYYPPNTQADALPNLFEAVSRWALEYPRVIVDDGPSFQAKDLVTSMEALELS